MAHTVLLENREYLFILLILFIDILNVILINTTDVRKITQEIYVILIIVIISTHSLFLLNRFNFLYLRRSFILFLFAIVFHSSYYADGILWKQHKKLQIERGVSIQWSVKRTNNDLPNTTQTKDWATQYSQTSSPITISITFVLNLYSALAENCSDIFRSSPKRQR